MKNSPYAAALRQEIGARTRAWARRRPHVESYGDPPVIVFVPEEAQHGNFFHAAYEAILARPEWMRRFDKVHAQSRSLPKAEPGRKWRELDSSMSSDALLMNVFCTPGIAQSAAVRGALGVDGDEPLEFGWKARVPLANGRFDRTEVDLRWGDLLIEAKLTEADFQTRAASVVEGYRDFVTVFDREALPRVELATRRRREATEFLEEISQEFESYVDAREREPGLLPGMEASAAAALASSAAQSVAGYAGYQLIRNVLAAHASGCRFCVLHDARRPDLREAWFAVMRAVRPAQLSVRLAVMTWQELAAALPEPLQGFLDAKYGIVAPGRPVSPAGA